MIRSLINKLIKTESKNLDEQHNINKTNLIEGSNQKTVILVENDISEKCQLIMTKLEDIIELSSQVNHYELTNIMITIYNALLNLQDNDIQLDKIAAACEETYNDICYKLEGTRKIIN